MRTAMLSRSLPLFSLLAASCVGGRPVHYYTMAAPPVVAVPAKPDGLVLVVGHIETPEALQDGRIRYRSGNEVGSYEYHRWIERPALMVRDSLMRELRASGKYHQVQEASTAAGGDFLIRGKLSEFSEVDDPGIRTRVSLLLELIDRKNGRMVWDRQYDREEPVSGKDMKEVVRSLDHNLQQVIAEAASGIESFLAAVPQNR
ncbi:MAG TPA: ABC-type transport auxiliary lipoprotein family protein [Bryobacteraceae bacterium]